MMPSKSHSILLMLLLWSMISRSQIAENSIDVQLKNCLAESVNPSTANMCNCTYDALHKWDSNLNDVYQQLMSLLKTPAKEKLKSAQKQWVAFKEKEVALIDATYGSAEGTMWSVVRAEKVMTITRQRALELALLLESASSF